MCGRFSLFAAMADVEERFGARFEGPYERQYNAAPGQSLPVIQDARPGSIVTAEWGLEPRWAETRSDAGFINARAETATEKRSFSAAMVGAASSDEASPDADQTAGRCLVPADGFYEWGDADGSRQPYRLRLPDGDLFAMAGLWTRWRPTRRQTGLGEFDAGAGAFRADTSGADAPTLDTFAILTTTANEAVAEVHDRMPVVLSPDEEGEWLSADVDRAATLCDPYDGPMEVYAVSERVNNPSNDDPRVIEPRSG